MEGGEDVECVWLCKGCVATPIQEMRLAGRGLCGLVECVSSVATWVLLWDGLLASGDILLNIGVREALGGLYVSAVWPVPTSSMAKRKAART